MWRVDDGKYDAVRVPDFQTSTATSSRGELIDPGRSVGHLVTVGLTSSRASLSAAQVQATLTLLKARRLRP